MLFLRKVTLECVYMKQSLHWKFAHFTNSNCRHCTTVIFVELIMFMFALLTFVLSNHFHFGSCNDMVRCKLGSCSSKQYFELMSTRADSAYSMPNFKYDTVSNVDASFEFSQIFEKFMQNDLPFKSKSQVTSKAEFEIDQEAKDNMNRIVRDCAAFDKEGRGAETSLYLCMQKYISKEDSFVLMNQLNMPKVLSSNYMSRTNITSNCASGSGTIDYVRRWPVIQLLNANIPSVGSQCPSDMHTVIWGQDMPIKIRLFDTRMSSRVRHYFQCSNHYLDVAYYEQFLISEEKSEPDSYIHFPSFKRSGFPKYEEAAIEKNLYAYDDLHATPDAPFPRFQEVVLEPHEYLFVPHQYITSGLYLNENAKQDSVHVFKHCLVDASNFIAVKRKLDEESHGYCHAQQISEAFRHGFDVKMDRIPEEMTLGKYVSGYYDDVAKLAGDPGAAPGIVETSTEPVVDNVVDAPAESGSKPRSGRNRSKKKTGHFGDGESSSSSSRGASIREWQITKKWNMLITSLTLPPPYLPKVYQPDIRFRNSVKLFWNTPFRPSGQESTKFGFNVTLCEVGDKGHCNIYTLYRDTRLNDGSDLVHINTLTTFRNGVSARVETRDIAMRETVDRKQSAATGTEIYQYNVVLKQLQADTTYRYRMTMFYDQSESNPSEWSNAKNKEDVIVTLPYSAPSTIPHVLDEPLHCSAPGVYYGQRNEYIHALQLSYSSIALIYPKPKDTGGHNVLGYNIYMRYVSTPELMHHHPREFSHAAADSGGNSSEHTTAIHFNRMNEHLNHEFVYHDTVLLERDNSHHRNIAAEYIMRYKDGRTKSYLTYLEDVNYNIHVMHDILPMTSIDFKISSFNVLGASQLSLPSQVLHLHSNLDVDDSGALLGKDYVSLSSYGIDYKIVANQNPSLIRGRNNDAIATDALASLHQLVVQAELNRLNGIHGSGHILPIEEMNVSPLYNFVVIDEHKQTLSMAVNAARMPSNQHRYKLDGQKIVDQYITNPLIETTTPPSVDVVTHEGWGVHYSPKLTRMTFGSVVLSLPDLLQVRDQNKLKRADSKYDQAYTGRIVLCVRGGGIPLVMKVLSIQEAGGIGAIIVDDGSCTLESNAQQEQSNSLLASMSKRKRKKTKRSVSKNMFDSRSAAGGTSGFKLLEYDQKCIAGASKYAGERIGVNEIATPWLKVKIPVLFVTKEVAADLLSSTTIPLPPYILESTVISNTTSDGGESNLAVNTNTDPNEMMWLQHAKQFLVDHIQFVNRTDAATEEHEGFARDEL